jgi:cation-transporting P-type ATPase 13A2
MEIKTFEFGRFHLNQSHSDPNVIFGFESDRGHNGQVFRRFEFDSDLQRMSVICRNSVTKGCEVYCKGSPEIMTTIMQKQFIPPNYNEILKQYASHGFRVLSIASKVVSEGDMHKLSRGEAESELVFNGFEVFENKLKPETKGAIAMLKAAEIGCVMITGDNTLTGSNISYKCDISNKAKGMIICDFNDGKFVEDKFEYDEDDNTTDVSSKPTPPFAEIIINNNSLMTEKLKIELEEGIDSNGHLTSEDRSTSSAARFMEVISRKANLTNCQLCITGRAFNQFFAGPISDLTEVEKTFMKCVSVFARTKPNDKAKIVMAFQHMDMKVSMCGDGANDCGALKQADIGLSLSQAEASISAPFTSRVTNITSMVELIKECRAGLATNFSLFNVMAIYSLIEYTTTVISEKYLQYPYDLQYLYWDLCLNFFFIVFIGYTRTA